MPDRVEALVLQMSVDIRKLEKSMDKAREKTGKELGNVEKRFDKSADKIKGTAGKISSEFETMARRIPVVGEALAAIGPVGVAAAVGIGVAAAAIKGIWDLAQNARHALDDLGTAAQNTGFSFESYQALQSEAIAQDIEFNQLEKSLSKLQIGAAEAAHGQGELFSALKLVNPEITKQIVQARNQEERWNALSRAITASGDQLTKVSIAKAAFGKAGGQFVRILDGEGQSIESLTTKYRELGTIVDEKLVAAVGEADTRINLANRRMEVQGVRAAAAWLPMVEAVTNAWTGLNIQLGIFFDKFTREQDQQIQTVIGRMDELRTKLKLFEGDADARKIARSIYGDPQAIRNELARLDLVLKQKESTFNVGSDSNVDITDPAEISKQESAARAAAAERDRQRSAAAAILGQLGDTTQLVAIKEAEYNELVKAGFLTRTQATAALDQYIASLKKLTPEQERLADLQKRWNDLIEAQKTPIDKAREALTEFWDAVANGDVTDTAQAQEILRILTEQLQAAEQAAKEATPAFLAIAAAKKAIADADAAGKTPAERLAAERSRLNALVGPNFSQAEADKAYSLAVDSEAAKFRDSTRDAVKAGLKAGLVSDDWGTQLRQIFATGITDGLEDVLNRIADTLADFILGKPGDSGGGALAALGNFIFGGKRAQGGGLWPNKTYLVGENGPELLNLGANTGQIMNAQQVNALATPSQPAGAYIDASVTIGGVDFATWPMVQQALNAQNGKIASAIPGFVNATLVSNRRQKRRY